MHLLTRKVLFRATAFLAFSLGMGWFPHVIKAKPVELAVLLPFSGVYKTPANDVKDGFLLGIKQEELRQGIQLKESAILKFLDTRLDPDRSFVMTKKAIQEGAQAVMGIISSAVAFKIRDLVIEESKIPLILFGAAATPNLKVQSPLFLRTSYVAYQPSIALSLWLRENPPVDKEKPTWACIYADYIVGVQFCDGFKLGYEPYGVEVGRVPVPFKTLDKSPQLIQLAKLKPDFAFAFFAGSEAQVFIADYYRFKLQNRIQLTGPGFLVEPGLLRKYEQTIDPYNTSVGLLSATYWSHDLDNETNRNFVKLYQIEYGRIPTTLAVHGYDTGTLLVKAISQMQGEWDGEQLVALMRTLPVNSPRTGSPLLFNKSGDPINPGYIYVTKRKNDKLMNEKIGSFPSINMDDYLP